MSSDWYTKTGAPVDNSEAQSATMRAEFEDIETAMDKLPILEGRANYLLAVNGGGTRIISVTPSTFIGLLASGGVINFSDLKLSRANLIDSALTYNDLGNSGTTTQDLDYEVGSHQRIVATDDFEITTSNWPPAGNSGIILLEAVDFGAHSITLPTINWIMPDGTTTTTFATWLAAQTGRTALQTSGTDFFIWYTRDAGTTIYGNFAA